jgi:hypothetical protein
MSADVMLFKFLTDDMRSPIGTGKWTLNRWRSVKGEIVPCENGLHAATTSSLLPHISETLWRVEVAGDLVWHGEGINRKAVTRTMRAVERVEAWNERTTRLFAADCAERVLHHFEDRYPGDKRPREAIEVARRFAHGEATLEELNAAAAAAAAHAASAYTAATYASAAAAAAAAAAANAASAYTAATYTAGAAAAAYANAASAYTAGAERDWQARHLAEMLGLAWDAPALEGQP